MAQPGVAGLSAPHAGGDALIASAYLAGTNTRRVRRALKALFADGVGKDGLAEGAERLGSTRDLLNIIEALTQRGAGFKSLKDTWADTTSPHGRLMLTVLGGLAEFERELIRARTGDGRERAKERGVRFGRPRKLTPHQRQERWAS